MSQLLPLFINESGMTAADLKRVIETAPSRYKVYTIPKRSGEPREIAQPARELKVLQRILIDKFLSNLPVHPAATAYQRGMSIRDNAVPHSGRGPILKMDFQNFFPSIVESDWLSYCDEHQILSDLDRHIAALVMFRRAKGDRLLKLSVGAPSSPMLSNVLLYGFDELVVTAAEKRGIAYTRYADDMTFSGQRAGMLKDMVREVSNALRKIPYPNLKIKIEKTTFVTSSNRRTITGVVLANDGTIGIGYNRRRLVSAKVNNAKKGNLSKDELSKLAGELAFINVVEPAYLSKLADRYGQSTLDKIKRTSAAGSSQLDMVPSDK